MFQIICSNNRGADKSLAQPGRKQPRKHVRRRARFQQHVDASFHHFFFLHGKAPKEIHAILSETLACFLPGRAKDLSAHLQYTEHMQGTEGNHAIMTETLACSLPGRAKDLSAPL